MIKKVAIVIAGVLIILLPVMILLVTSTTNSEDEKIKEYCTYLYFNWIDYPAPATDLHPEYFSDPEVHNQLLDWFGYDSEGNPVQEKYANVTFAYNTPFIYEKTYVGIPFNSGNGIVYKMLVKSGGKYSEAKESIW